ncbi:MAG TPA: type II toxin-antitoxin system RelE/ParE family toxin [Pirellulales bacterium]|nr:type II toxin-antitoxin system RelE/ParE family toxin [Pirellulales bacterium]
MLCVLAEARAEAVEAAAWYDRQRNGLGAQLLDEIEQALHRIENAPQSFATWEPYHGPEEFRRCVLTRFPYVVIFMHRPPEVVVVAISHARRRPMYWLNRLT